MFRAPRLDPSRFSRLMLRIHPGLHSQAIRDAFGELEQRYAEPGRRYHTAEHIRHCIDEFALARPHLDDPDAAELALWYHDAVFEAGSPDNERLSAELFERSIGALLDPVFCARVVALILATAHREAPDSIDARYVIDIDLSSFGSPWLQFLRQSRDVRAEMSHHSDHDFLEGHRRFLRALEARERFYYTALFERRYGQIARSNVRAYIEHLESTCSGARAGGPAGAEVAMRVA